MTGIEMAVLFDVMLLERIECAVALGLAPDTVEKHVGWMATVNTTRARDRLVLRFARISPDPTKREQVFSPDNVHHAVYWTRPFGSGRAVRVVGIMWTADGNPRAFYGRIFPP